jgi:Eukaryotic aspartyl protease
LPIPGDIKFKNDVLDLDFEGKRYQEIVLINNEITLSYPVTVADKFVDVLNLAQEGVLGLGSDNKSIVYQMYSNGTIDQPIYSLCFLCNPLIVFGSPNFYELSLVVDSVDVISLNQTLFARFGFNGTDFLDLYDVEFNSITSYITGPFEILEYVYRVLVVDYGCSYEEELLVCECPSDFIEYPSFELTIQDSLLTVEAASYLIPVFNN